MAQPLRRDLVARRNAPLGWEWADIVDDAGDPIDLAAAEDLRMQVRLYGAAKGAALITLTGVSSALTEGLIPGLGSVQGFIDEPSLALLPVSKAGATDRFRFDALFDFAGTVPEVWVRGDLIVHPGVTDRLKLRITDSSDARITDDGSYRITE